MASHWLERGAVRAEVLPLGAAVHRFQLRFDGGWRDLILSRSEVTRNDASYFGATIGRVTNRIAGARFELDGVVHELRSTGGGFQLHGGPDGFADRPWRVVSAGPDAVRLSLISPDGDQGYPGQLTVEARFSLLDDGLRIEYAARTDRPTVVNLTSHPYFALGGPLDEHVLTVPAGSFTPTSEDHLPTGELQPVAGTALDFRAGRRVGEALAEAETTGLAREGGLNHNLVVDGHGLREHARLTGPDGLTITVRSDAPAVQLYSAEHLARAGLAIEPQGYPDAPNQPAFPSVVLRPGETYARTIEWLVTG